MDLEIVTPEKISDAELKQMVKEALSSTTTVQSLQTLGGLRPLQIK